MNENLKEKTSTMQINSLRDNLEERIDLRTGRVVLDHTDFEWGGELMPVSIHHVYNSAISNVQYTASENLAVGDYPSTKLGLGWKLNIMQSMVPRTVSGVTNYYYTDGEGNTTEFVPTSTENIYCSVDNEENVYNSEDRTLTMGNYVYIFDFSYKSLVSITDTERNITMNINYDQSKIISVTDGAGREFTFTYLGNKYLEKITAPDNSCIKFEYAISYDGSNIRTLDRIIRYGSVFENGVYVQSEEPTESYYLTYTDTIYKPSSLKVEMPGMPKAPFYNEYTFNGGKIEKIDRKYNVDSTGASEDNITTFYAITNKHTSIAVSESNDHDNAVVTEYIFDNDGNLMNEYVIFPDRSIHVVSTGFQPVKPNSAEAVTTYGTNENLIANHTFNNAYVPGISGGEIPEDIPGHAPEGTYVWRNINGSSISDSDICDDETKAMYGRKSLILNSTDSEMFEQGFYQAIPLTAGLYTYSAYVKVEKEYTCLIQDGLTGIYLRVTNNGEILDVSEAVCETGDGFARINATFTVDEDCNNIHIEILQNGMGTAYVSCPVLNRGNTVEEYNMLETAGTYANLGNWIFSNTDYGSIGYCSNYGFNSQYSIRMIGRSNISSGYKTYQYVYPKKDKNTYESYVFSAWATADKIPLPSSNAENYFELKLCALILYSDGTSESFVTTFENIINVWRKAELRFEKSKSCEIDSIQLYCSLDCRYGDDTVYLSDFKFYREDVVNGIGTETVEESEYKQMYSADKTSFEEKTDDKGNILTDTICFDNYTGTLYRAFAFSENGNDKIAETDTRGNITTYAVDDKNSRITSVTDRCGNVTEYEYDKNGNVSKVTRKDSSGNACSTVDYTHDANGNVTNITRGDGKEFDFEYNTQGLLTNAAGMVTYDYKLSSGRLKSMTYSNGSTVTLTYDRFGRIVNEHWVKGDIVEADYRYIYDKNGNLSSSIDTVNGKEYNYYYDNGNVIRISENNVTLSDDVIVTSRASVSSIKYTYDSDGRVYKKEYPSSGLQVYYRHGDDGTCIKYQQGNTVTEVHTETDKFGRVKAEEIRTGNNIHYRKFEYAKGEITDEHKPEYDADGNLVRKGKIVSNPTTNLVSAINLSNRTLTYGYDEEERITHHTDYSNRDNYYIYDAQGQLTSHTVEDDTTYYEYDSYGNILAKGKIRGTDGKLDRESTQNCFYIYTDHEKLVSYTDGTNTYSFAYDTLGNPTTYKGKTLVWEKGRQLKEYGTKASYTYNANGIRTSRTLADGTVYNYELEGSKIVKVTCGENVIIPLYDNNDSPVGIIHNGKFYWYAKNLQGDVLAIRDETDYDVVRYNYDAWGKVQINRDYSGCNLALLNPFLYRGYVYDYETKLYYLNSRYYDPEIGRFINADEPTFIGAGNSLSPNAYAYCDNEPVNDKDVFGCLSAKKLAEMFSITSIFGLFAPMLFANYSQGLVSVGVYTTKIMTPIAAKIFWWKPWLIPVIIAAAVGIVVAGVAIYFSKKSKQSAKERAKDAPSWLADVMNALPPHWGEKAKDYAKRLLDQKYGKGNWKTGPNTEYNKIVKYLVRHVGMS